MEFKNRLRQLRREYNFTQTKLAKMLGYGASTVSNYESGKNEPSITDLIKLADIFQVSLDYLLGYTHFCIPYGDTSAFEKADKLIRYYNQLSDNAAQQVLSFCQFKFKCGAEENKNNVLSNC